MNLKDLSECEKVFLEAIELAPEDRHEFLAKRCAGLNTSIQEQVEELLEGDSAAARAHLSKPPVNVARFLPSVSHQLAECIGDSIGNYRLTAKIGEGGMGIVFAAEQTRPIQRRVALKVIKPGMDSEQVIARFEAERQALALMDHPNIANVLDASTTDRGRPYFVMELVQGNPITEYCDDQRLSLNERLELFITVCQAVQHAHQKGIIHRDLKPSNILVAHDGAHATPKVIDFGVAKATIQKLTDKTLFTQYGQIVGTLEYMSPEQSQYNQLDVDTRSDIYSLGIILYELLTGTIPLDRERLQSTTFDEMLRIIRQEEPPRPSSRLRAMEALSVVAEKRRSSPHKLKSLIRGELDWIVMRSLEKDRAQRYETAAAFATDIQRYLSDEPVFACPPSARYRIKKALRRNLRYVIAVSIIFLSLVAGVIGTSLQWLRSNRLAEVVQQSGYFSDMKLANLAYDRGDVELVRELLRRHIPSATPGRDHRHFEWHYLAGLINEIQRIPGHGAKGQVDGIGFIAEGDATILAVLQNETLSMWPFPLTAGRRDPIRQFAADYSNEWYWIPCAAISPDGSKLGLIENIALDDGSSAIRLTVTDTRTGMTLDSVLIDNYAPHDESPDLRGTALAFSGDGQRLATGHWNGTLVGWRLSDEQRLERVFTKKGHSQSVAAISFTAGGDKLVSASWDRTACLWQFGVDAPASIFEHDSRLTSVVISRDGTQIFSASERGLTHIWNVDTQRHSTFDEGGVQFAVALSPDEHTLAIGGNDGMIRLRDVKSGTLVTKLRGHNGGVRKLAFSPDGSWMASGDDLGRLNLWYMLASDPTHSAAFTLGTQNQTQPTERIVPAGDEEVFDIAFHPHQNVVAICADQKVAFWDLDTGQLDDAIETLGKSRSVTFSPDGSKVVVGSWAPRPRGTQIFNYDTRQPQNERDVFDANVAALGSDGKTLVLSRDRDDGSKTADIFVVDIQRGEKVLEIKSSEQYQIGYGANRFTISPDNSRLAFFAHSGSKNNYAATIHLWDLRSRNEVWVRSGHDKPIHSLTFSPDGRLLVSTSDDHTIRLLDGESGDHIRTLKGHRSWVMEGVFLRDGIVLATASVDGTVRLWDVSSGKERFVFRGDGSPFTCIAVSPDGTSIAAGNRNGKAWLWHAKSGHLIDAHR